MIELTSLKMTMMLLANPGIKYAAIRHFESTGQQPESSRPRVS